MDSDMGVGTIIGSLLFNTLGVAAVAGLASIKVKCYKIMKYALIPLNNFTLYHKASEIGTVAYYTRLDSICDKFVGSDLVFMGFQDNLVRINRSGCNVFHIFCYFISK